jgi:SAM-dependent methyltransferase
VNYSEERIDHAKTYYGRESKIDFQIHDLRDPLDSMGPFDLIWDCFVLEYNRVESADIVKNLTAALKPGGYLCLLDLDRKSLNHHKLPAHLYDIPLEVPLS